MKESGFRLSVHSHIPKAVHKQPMLAGMFGEAGTPDTYYDFKTDLWVEYKFHHGDSLPKMLKGDALPNPKQQEWLTRRFRAGSNAIAITGFRVNNKTLGFIMLHPGVWSALEIPREAYEPYLMSAKAIADYITTRVS